MELKIFLLAQNNFEINGFFHNVFSTNNLKTPEGMNFRSGDPKIHLKTLSMDL